LLLRAGLCIPATGQKQHGDTRIANDASKKTELIGLSKAFLDVSRQIGLLSL